MILPKRQDALHKVWLYRLLTAICDDQNIAGQLFFKGGTCAAMLGRLDRFSIDLDFDLAEKSDINRLKPEFYKLFDKLGLEIKDESKKVLHFFLRYVAKKGQRNTIKLEIVDKELKSSRYSFQYLPEIDRSLYCQTKETMFAHKLAAVIDRYKKHKTIAGRDIYDIHYFFLQGFSYEKKVIEERTGITSLEYLKKLVEFIEKKVTQTIIDQDLNVLIAPEKFKLIRKILKTETLMFLKEEAS